MNDDEDEVVEMTDEDEIKVMEAQVSSYGHKPLVGYTGMQVSTRPHRNLDRRRQTNVVLKKTKMPILVVLPLLIYMYEVALKLLPNTLSTNSVSSSNPTTAIPVCVISFMRTTPAD